MRSNIIYILWLMCFSIVLGCAFWPSDATAERPASASTTPPATTGNLEGLPYRGIAIQVQRTDWIDKYKQCIDDAAEMGADTVSLVVDTRMENGKSNRVWLDMRMTPTPDQLGSLIDHAKSRKLRVLLVPIVLLDNPVGTEWRGTIKPESWDDWFDSYRDMMIHFAWIAEQHKVDIMSIGSELVSAEEKVEQWRKTIVAVREVFSGKLTYSANWDHFDSISFWVYLDLVGMNSYWKLGEDANVTVDQINKEWLKWQKGVLEFQAKVKKPILFTEVGWCSMANAASEPWDYTKTSEALDLDLQARLYEGFFQSWYGDHRLGGFMIWEWPPDQGGKDNKGYIPKGKPAEQVLRTWLAKPRWKVR